MGEIVRELRDIHDALNCNVRSDGSAFKSASEREGEVERAMNWCWKAAARIEALEAGLKAMTDHYVRLANSGDCGFWNADAEPEVEAARRLLSDSEAQPK